MRSLMSTTAMSTHWSTSATIVKTLFIWWCVIFTRRQGKHNVCVRCRDACADIFSQYCDSWRGRVRGCNRRYPPWWYWRLIRSRGFNTRDHLTCPIVSVVALFYGMRLNMSYSQQSGLQVQPWLIVAASSFPFPFLYVIWPKCQDNSPLQRAVEYL